MAININLREMGSEGIICFFRKIWYEVEHFVKQFIIHFLFIFYRVGEITAWAERAWNRKSRWAVMTISPARVRRQKRCQLPDTCMLPRQWKNPLQLIHRRHLRRPVKDIYDVTISSAVLVTRAFIPESRYSIFGFPKWLRIAFCSD